MAEITQKLGFDVTQGVKALNSLTDATKRLTSSLRELNKVSLGNVSKKLSGLNRGLGNTPKKAAAAQKSMSALGNASGVGAATQQLNGLNNSLGQTQQKAAAAGNSVKSTFAGAFVFGAALSGLRDIVSLLGDAANASKEFQQAIAEVSTISGNVGVDTLTTAVRNLSVEFGKPTVEQAEAAYQAFSNQVVNSASDMSFLTDANKLAIATVSETGDAVNALSSILNTYGQEAGTATQISDVLFKTVEEGRTRMSEFANSLGSVLPLAKESGVSFNEVAAALATITKSGTTTSVAMTQIRGIVSKLLKPTEQMNQAFRSFGATDGPSAIAAAGGLNPLLQKMSEFAAKNGTSLVKMFGRVRGGTGALTLAANEGENFNEVLKKLDSSAGAAQAAFDKIDGSPAREAEKAFNELRVRLEELGDTILPIITKFVQMFNKVIPNAKTMGVAIGGVTIALGLLAAGAANAVIPLGAIVALLGPFGIAAAAVAATTLIAVGVMQQMNKEVQKRIDLSLEESKQAKKTADETVLAEEKKLAAIETSFNETKAFIEDVFSTQLATARESNAKVIASFQGVLDAFADSRSKVIKSITDAIKGADAEIAASAGRLKSAQQELADIKFDDGLKNLTDQGKVAATLSRALKTAAESRRELGSAGLDQEKTKEALEKRATARRQLDDAERRAASTKTTQDDKTVADAKKRFLKQIVRDEKLRAATVKKLRDEELAKVKTVEEAMKKVTAEVQTLGDVVKVQLAILGQMSTGPKEAEIATQTLIKALEKVNELAGKDVTGGLAKKLGGQKGDTENRKGSQQLLEGTAKAVFDTAQIRKNLQDAIGTAPFEALVNIKDQQIKAEVVVDEARTSAKLAALQLTLEEQLAKQALNVPVAIDTNVFDTVTQKLAALFVTATTDINAVFGPQGLFTKSINDSIAGIGELDKAGIEAAKNALENVDKALKENQKTGKDPLDSGQLANVEAQIANAKAIIQTRSEQLELQGQAVENKAGELPAKIDDATTATNNLKTAASKVAPEVAKIGPTAASQIGSINQVATAWKQVTKAAQEAAAAGGGAGAPTQTAFFGKAIHRQTGGFTRGQDRIATSTAPGEFVMNAASTRQFRSQLTAMNAGQKPQFREKGGAVTNVGDINVNIQSSDASDIRGRDVARDLKRELRTRSSSL